MALLGRLSFLNKLAAVGEQNVTAAGSARYFQSTRIGKADTETKLVVFDVNALFVEAVSREGGIKQ